MGINHFIARYDLFFMEKTGLGIAIPPKYKPYIIPISLLLLGSLASWHTLNFYAQLKSLWLS